MQKIKNNWFTLAVALFVAISVGFPELYFVYDVGKKIQGAPLMGAAAEEHYLASMREAYDGRYVLSNTYSIPKNIPFLYPEGGEVVAGFLSRVTGLGVISFNTLMKFLSPFVLFLFVYKLAFFAGRNKYAALLSAAFVILGSNLAARPDELFNLFGFGKGYHPGFNNYFRPINPEISSILFFGYLVLFYKFLKSPRILSAILLGFILGASFYFYLFTWTFLLVLTGLFLIFSFVVKNYEQAKKISFSLIVAAILSIPYWLATFKAITSPVYAEAALRFGMKAGRSLFISGSLALVASIAVFLFIRYLLRRSRNIDKSDASIFGALFGLTTLIVYNQQVITGQSIQSPHYHLMTTVPMLIIFTVFLAWNFLQKINFFKKKSSNVAIVAVAVGFLFLNNFNWQMFSYNNVKQTAYERQEYMPVIKWAEENISENSMIFANTVISSLVPVFTPLDIYPSGFAQYYLLPRDVFKRYTFLKAWFAGVKPEDAEKKFLGELRNKLSYEVYGIQYRKNMPDEEAIKLAREYAVFHKENLNDVLENDYYKPNYFIFDQKFNEMTLSEIEINSVMKQVAIIDGRFLVYKMK